MYMKREFSKFDEVLVALSHVAELVKHGNYNRASSLLEEILAIADEIGDIDEKFASFFQIARAYIMIGQPEKAKKILESIDKELADLEDIRSKFYRLVIKIERIKYGLTKISDSELESIRIGFKKLYEETRDVSIARYYIAFLVLVWAPTYKKSNLEYAIRIIRDTLADLEDLKSDPQYAELLTTLAELLVDKKDFVGALNSLEEAVRIYLTNRQYFKDTIRSIITFVKERMPLHYKEFVSKLNLSALLGDNLEFSTKETD